MTTRHVLGEYILRGTLVARSPLALATGDAGALTDQSCARDGLGRLIIPGSAVAGILRPTFEADAQWGSQDRASLLYVEDAVALDAPPPEVRDGVAIDRRTGAASEHLLYSREVVPAGTRFEVTLRVEVVDRDKGALSKEDAKSWLTAIARDLAQGRDFGARTSAGLGRVHLREATVTWLGTGDREGLLAVLSGDTQNPEAIDLDAGAASRLVVTVPWRACSPLLVSVAFNGLVDRIPQTTTPAFPEESADGLPAAPHLVIPGTSWKGALRSRAEWIVRTVTDQDAPEGLDTQLIQDLGPTGRLFGLPPHKVKQGSIVTRNPGSRGAMRVGEVYSRSPVMGWHAMLKALTKRTLKNDKPDNRLSTLIEAIKKVTATKLLRINDHVAISRWTGGADEGKLFATVAPLPEPEGTPASERAWDPLIIEVDLSRLGDDAEVKSSVYLLALLLRDLADGWIGIGHGSTRGYGEVVANPEDIQFTFPSGSEASTGLQEFTLESFFASDALNRPFKDAWRTEIARLTPPQADFGGDR